MKNKIFPSVVLTIFVFFVSSTFFSCKNENQNSSEEKTPVTFTFFSADLSESVSFTDAVAKEITRRTGVTLEVIPAKGEVSDMIDLMVADNSYPDLIFAKGSLSTLVENSAVIPLDDFINQKGENVKRLYGNQLSKLRYSPENPSIYTLGAYEVKKEVNETSGSLQIQNAVLKEFGYPKIKTLEDYENLLLAYMKKYPEINGHKTVGLSFVASDWLWFVDLSNPGNYVLGCGDDGQWIVNQYNYKATYKFLVPKMSAFYKWLNRLYNEGLLDSESFTQSLELWKTKVLDGYVLGTSCPYWQISDLQKEISQMGQVERSFAFLPITAEEGLKEPSLKDYGFSGGWGIAISEKCKNPERAFEFLDFLCSQDAQILTNWGIEGTDYYYDRDGKRIALTDSVQDKKRGIGQWTYPFPQAGSGYKDYTGNFLGKSLRENVERSYNSAEIETITAYGGQLWTDLFPQSDELGISYYGQVWQYPLNTQFQSLVDDVDEFVHQSLVSIILDSPESFDQNWEKMCTQIKKMGIEQAGDEITRMIVSKVEFWQQ